ncbi:hypothetical protein [Segniliparus rotundus]|nr:hypothetical protein [Segniliparus rotundus]
MTGVAAVLRQGGQQVEQQARNQALALVNDLMRPTTRLGFTLPLALWGTILDSPMREILRVEIRGDIQAAHAEALSRHEGIVVTVQGMQDALAAESAQAIPSSGESTAISSVQARGRTSYGYGGNTWWEDDLAPAS